MHFRVARTFKGLSDATAEQISEYLIETSNGEGTCSDKVTSLAQCFKERFGQFNLSAASKLLWLRNRSPYVIYDARAVTALCRLKNKFNKSDYSLYCTVWKKEYEKRFDEISLAAHGLVDLPKKYTAAYYLTADQLTEIVDSGWFIERVFDIYLWELGDKDQA
jgi:hypothetical protein